MNAVERALRRVALGRANWVNIGTEEGGRRVAVIDSLGVTRREIGMIVTEYRRDVRLRSSTRSDFTKLTPHG